MDFRVDFLNISSFYKRDRLMSYKIHILFLEPTALRPLIGWIRQNVIAWLRFITKCIFSITLELLQNKYLKGQTWSVATPFRLPLYLFRCILNIFANWLSFSPATEFTTTHSHSYLRPVSATECIVLGQFHCLSLSYCCQCLGLLLRLICYCIRMDIMFKEMKLFPSAIFKYFQDVVMQGVENFILFLVLENTLQTYFTCSQELIWNLVL